MLLSYEHFLFRTWIFSLAWALRGILSSFHAYWYFGFHCLHIKMLLLNTPLVTKSKTVLCVCLHLGYFVHWRRLQTSSSDGLPTISASAHASLLAERKKPPAKIYWHRRLPWQTDPQSQCPSHAGGGHSCVRCIILVFLPLTIIISFGPQARTTGRGNEFAFGNYLITDPV